MATNDRAHWDLPQGKGDWTCWQWVRDIDAVRHTNSWNECNEAEFIIDDLSTGIALLSKLEAEVQAGPRG